MFSEANERGFKRSVGEGGGVREEGVKEGEGKGREWGGAAEEAGEG